MSELRHLIRRFCSSLSREDASAEDRAWARTIMTPAEAELWATLSPRDRRHTAKTARHVEKAMGITDHVVLAAALLHDVGKAQSRFGVPGRVFVAVTNPLVSDGLALRLSRRSGVVGDYGKLLRYTDLGAQMLVEAGSAEFISSWAKEHHESEEGWTVVQPDLGRMLQAADARS